MTKYCNDDYFCEIDSFYTWGMANAPTASVVSLWHALMHTWRSLGRPVTFTISIKALSIKTGLSKNAILRARNSLRQLGRIDWAERKGNQSARYRIVTFGEADGVTHVVTLGETLGETHDEARYVSYNNNNNNNKDSLNNNNNAGIEGASDAKAYYEGQTGNVMSRRGELQLGSFLERGLRLELVMRAVDASIDRGANNWAYAAKMLENCIEKGVLTLEDYEKAEKDRVNGEGREGRERNVPSGRAAGRPAGKPDDRKIRKTGFSNFRERDVTDFDTIKLLEMERIDRELGIERED